MNWKTEYFAVAPYYVYCMPERVISPISKFTHYKDYLELEWERLEVEDRAAWSCVLTP